MKKKIAIIVANYYPKISEMLLEGLLQQLKKNNNIKNKIIFVPGIFEIPFAIAKNINRFDGFVALGCVIKGKTPHFGLISKSVINAIMDLSIKSKKPIGNGIITCLNKKQAYERADPNKKNKGGEAIKAVIWLFRTLG
tara:strand:+ start:933 stop:1346 length:414 start_codon:yes stop_codon:yes gene_type:complete